MAQNLTDEELKEFSVFSSVSDDSKIGNLTDEEGREFKEFLKTKLTPGTVPFAEPVFGREEKPFDIVDVAREAKEKAVTVGQSAAELGEQLARPRTALATAGGAAGLLTPAPAIASPALAAVGGAVGTAIEELEETFEVGAPNTTRQFLMDEALKAGGPVFNTVRISNRLARGIQASPEFFPPFTEDEKSLIQNEMGGVAIASQMFRGRLGDVAGRAAKNATIDAAIEGAGLAVAKSITRAKRGGFFKVSQQAQEVADIVEPLGGQLSLPQLTDIAILDFADNVSRAGVLSRETMQRFDDISEASLRASVEEVNDQFMTRIGRNLTRSEIAAMAQSGLDIGQFAGKAIERKLYRDVAKESRRLGIQVPARKIKLARTKLEKEFEKKFNVGFTDEIKTNLDKLVEMPTQIDFDVAHDLRSAFKTIARESGEAQVRRSANIMVDAIGDSMDDALKAVGPEGVALKRMATRADRFFKFDKKVFEDDFMAKLFINNKKSSQVIGEAIYKNGNVDEVKKVIRGIKRADRLSQFGKRRGIKDPITKQAIKTFDADETIKAVRQGYNTKFLDRHFVQNQTTTLPLPGTQDRGIINWDSMLQDLGDNKTRETMEVLFGPGHHKKMVDLARSGQFLLAKSPGNANALALATMSAAIKTPRTLAGVAVDPSFIAVGGFAKAVAGLTGILGFPQFMAKKMTDKNFIKWAINGQKELAKGTQAGMQAFFTSMSRALKGTVVETKKRIRGLDPTLQPLVPGEIFTPNIPAQERIQP